jgi:hypothetical protein
LRRFNLDAALYCIAWAGLALLGWNIGGLRLGLLLSVGLFLIVMPASAFILSRTGNFRTERIVRWSLLLIAAVALLSFSDLSA